MTPISWKLSPSDLTFLWDECPRCFYLKVVHKFGRPYSPFPSVFGRIDLLMKDYYENKSTQEMDASMPPGKVLLGEKWVESAPISVQGHEDTVYIRGKFDSVVEFEDSSFGVIDFKTSQPKPHLVEFYGRQLHAYAHALEHPAPGKLQIAPISLLGLLIVTPALMTDGPDGRVNFEHTLTWMPVVYKPEIFFEFLDKVLTVLEKPEPPEAAEKCSWCKYREKVRANPRF
ncbi:MAG: PD-(D/E)XK nuclease family protein [Chloroflexota bacterium]